jgi:FkbM family methyltransferase
VPGLQADVGWKMKSLKQVARTVSRRIARGRGPMSRALYKMATEYMKSYNNLDYDIETNGEIHILDCLTRVDIRTVFDVGANEGVYTRACISRFKNAEIHAFEIAPPTYEKLARNSALARGKLNNFGPSNSEGVIDPNYSQDDDGKSSLIGGGDIINEGSFRTMTANATTGDRYCQYNAIPSIDLLKIDVEGAEHLVLEGFTGSFERDRQILSRYTNQGR